MCLAVPGKILSVSGDDPLMRMAKVSFGGLIKEVSLAYVPEAAVGDYVIVFLLDGRYVHMGLDRFDVFVQDAW